MPQTRTLLSVQTGQARRMRMAGRSLMSAMVKLPVQGPVPVGPLGLLGDEQADLSIHGGLGKAVYAYPAEHYPFWQQARREAGVAEIDDSLPHGSLAENLTLSGLLESGAWVGDVLRFPNCTLEVASPREPCHKLNAAMGFARAVRLVAESGFCGFYLRVREPGSLSAGQSFELIPGPRSMGIPELFHAKRVKHLRGEF
jgi:MOSC domain-containing protein YiiM